MKTEELNRRIETVCEQFKGQIPDLYHVVGVVVVGRLFGWRVVRLTTSRKIWSLTTRLFGDPKEWMPERGRLARKSIGLELVDTLADYWDFINGVTPRDDISARDRKMVV